MQFLSIAALTHCETTAMLRSVALTSTTREHSPTDEAGSPSGSRTCQQSSVKSFLKNAAMIGNRQLRPWNDSTRGLSW